MFGYSGLEKEVDSKTPDWIVSCGKMKEFLGWECVVTFKEKEVRKAKFQDGKWTLSNNTHAYPDFILLDEESFCNYTDIVNRVKLGYNEFDPIRSKFVSSRFFIEIFGDYWHSGLYVQGLSKEEHQKEVEEAYISAGCQVLVLWEEDIKENWDDICIPKITSFIHDNKINVLPWDLLKIQFNAEAQKSLLDPNYWRQLSFSQKDNVIKELVENYQKTGYPFPLKMQAQYDYRRFLKWANGSKQKESVFGNCYISFFSKSMIKARVKNYPSLIEIWQNRELMERCIRWQLENENGKHHAKRFLAAMLYERGFRKISSMGPSKVLMLTKGKTVAGGIFFDACAGWGGRMLAAHAAGMKYIGIDANKELTQELIQMRDELKIDAEIYHGDSSDKDFLFSVMNGRKADLCFTSVPYFDKEIYSTDKEQSIISYSTEKEWAEGFLSLMTDGVLDILSENGVFLLNISIDINLFGFSEKFGCSEKLIEMKSGSGKVKERLLTITRDKDSKITCRICGSKMHKLGYHLKSKHKITVEDYTKTYGGETVSSQMSSDISSRLKRRKGMGYDRKIAYRLKNGKIVRRKDVWFRSWNNEPPADTILSGEAYLEQKKEDESKKIEGVDYVSCVFCGFKSSNISRHLKKCHGVLPSDYKGEIYGSIFKSRRYNPWNGHLSK